MVFSESKLKSCSLHRWVLIWFNGHAFPWNRTKIQPVNQKRYSIRKEDKAIHAIRTSPRGISVKNHELLYLSTADVEKVGLPMKSIVDAVEDVFREKGEGRTEMPPKPGIHPVKDSFIHAMPAYVASMRAAGMK